MLIFFCVEYIKKAYLIGTYRRDIEKKDCENNKTLKIEGKQLQMSIIWLCLKPGILPAL